ncbi:unnamed protein product [Lactuca saligna]|uniref:DNA helicase Pif1-like 2B domain-containing protein n=1 Tax=Lactuca saligna TaxID=75948 RepID=A0AA35VMN7_LACSI|nr:unnamed protein product [Lactuca saligna]
MRVDSSEITTNGSMSASAFATWLLRIGDGVIGVPDKDDPQDSSFIEIPDSLLIKPGPESLKTLIHFFYGDTTLTTPTAVDLSVKAIVSPTNYTADDINEQILRMVTSDGRTYNSLDTIQPNGKYTSDFEGLYPIEYLNHLTFPRIPPHELKLKIHCPIMLLRNINQKQGLCNGTRMIVSQLLPNVIEASIMTGTCMGKRVYIPRIKFIHKSPDTPFTFSRKQFPLKVCYAMTINKSQGQSLHRIGVYLPQPVFSHGQLYVALSRATHLTSSMTNISNLKTDGIGGPLQVRILRKWKHDVRRYETWYLGVNKFGDAIQILGQRTNQSYIESVLNVLECYTISDYSCPKLDKYQKFLENDFYIDVGLMSVIEHISDTVSTSLNPPRYTISFSHTFTFYFFSYYIGVLSKIRDYTKIGGESFILLILTDESGSEIAINLWKDCIGNPQKFDRTSLHPPPATTVVTVTNLKPSISNGPSRPLPPLPGTLTTLYEMKSKNRSELLDKTFLVRASIKEFVYQNSWYQTTCPNCKDLIFRRGENWFCSAHGHIDKPNYTYKLSIIVSDATDTITATMSETSCRKLLKSTLDYFLSNTPLTDGRILPQAITNHKEEPKKCPSKCSEDHLQKTYVS